MAKGDFFIHHHPDKFNPSFHEIDDFRGARNFHQSLDTADHFRLWVDHMVNPQMILIQQCDFLYIFLVSEPRHLDHVRIQVFGDHTGNEIDLIAVGCRQQHIGFPDACIL